MAKEVAIVYMVAGVSSRFGGRIKQFAKVGPLGETLIEYSVNQAVKAGFSKIIFVVGNRTETPFKELFGSNYSGIPVFYTLQKYDERKRNKPWGTTDSICTIKGVVDCPFVVCNGDDIYGENTFKILYNHLQESDEEATIGYKLGDAIPEEGAVKRGIFNIENEYIKKITETFNIVKSNLSLSGTKLSDMCSQNIFALHPKVVDLLLEVLNRFKQEHEGNRNAEALLPNDISSIIEQGKIKMKVYATPDKWMGVTNPEDEEVVREQLKL